jgi:hypothetical protein
MWLRNLTYLCEMQHANIKQQRYEIWHLPIVMFLVFFCTSTFLKMFHFTRICQSPHSPSMNSWTCACGIYGNSMEILFVPPCCSPFFHTNSTFENGDFERFRTFILGDLGVHPMTMTFQILPYKKGTHVKIYKHGWTCITPTFWQTLNLLHQYTIKTL